MKEIKGSYLGKGKKIGIVVSRFNEFISSQLIAGCVDTLFKQGVAKENITVVWAPGSFEMPQILSLLAGQKKYDALIALGTIIRGETPHFDYIASETAKGVAHIGLTGKLPVVFGVITADTSEQAMERGGLKAGNKGREAALAAIEMADIYSQL
ncbi:MAG: 6,7-dimethyl-8-ribityllumazine synthase [Candidatus Omnitrophota bacterium]